MASRNYSTADLSAEVRQDLDRDRRNRQAVIESLANGLEDDPCWRGWDFWRVTTSGIVDAVTVLRSWTPIEVWRASFDLQVKSLLEGMA